MSYSNWTIQNRWNHTEHGETRTRKSWWPQAEKEFKRKLCKAKTGADPWKVVKFLGRYRDEGPKKDKQLIRNAEKYPFCKVVKENIGLQQNYNLGE